MTIAILATGDELIYGDTLNTTTQAIAHALSSEGLTGGRHLVCGDKEQDIVDGIRFLSQNHNIVILTGGLGPTSDDLTRFALARFLNISLVESPQALAHVQTILTRANLPMNPGNRQQALFPQSATMLPTPHGTATGCSYSQDNTLFIMLPGPPHECMPMFNDYVLPALRQTSHSDKQLLKWRLFGLAEGEIAHTLDEALSAMDCETGYRLETPYIEFKVRCYPSEVAAVREIIDPLVEPHIIASPEQKASERLRCVIDALAEPVVMIDDATGGTLQTLLQRPENYNKLAFHDHKNCKLRFHLSGLEAYWSKRTDTTLTQVTIKYENDKGQGSETHELPFRSPRVLALAAEWLSFRLIHLIEQLRQG